MQEIYVAISKKTIIDAYLAEISKEQNGAWEVHIFPKMFNDGNSYDNPKFAKLQCIQAGNSYGPTFDYSKISIFSVCALVDEEALESYTSEIGEYDNIREQAKSIALSSYGVNLNNENAVEAALNEFKEEIDKAMDKCEAEAKKFDREAIAACIRESITDDNLQIRYIFVFSE